MGDELVQLMFVPDQPDIDPVVKNFAGERLALFNTSPEAHTADSSVYKVQLLKPGEEMPPNGLPIFTLTYRNDDRRPGFAEDPKPGASFEVVGRASLAGRELVRVADPDRPLRLVSLMPAPDLVVSAEPKEIVLEPGQEVPLTIKCDRRNGFAGRVPYQIANLPPSVVVADIGFTGGFVTEKESSRTVRLRAADWAEALEQPVYVVGQV